MPNRARPRAPLLGLLALLAAALAAPACAHDAAAGSRSPAPQGSALIPPAASGTAPPSPPSLPLVGEDAFAAPPPPPPLPSVALGALRAEIDAILDQPALAGATHSVLIVAAESGAVVFERSPDRLLEPASNVKLVTTSVALERLGPEHRAALVLYAAGAPAPDGTLSGDLVLQLEHEASLSTGFYPSEHFVLDQLAAQLRARGVRTLGGSLVVQGELVYQGNPVGTYDPDGERTEALGAFKAALGSAGVAVHATAASAALAPPDAATPFASWPSLPLGVELRPINRQSHNELADLLSRQLGWELRHESSLAAGGAEMLAWLGAVGLDTKGVQLLDGSGLSHDDRLSARHIVGVLRHMLQRPEGAVLLRSLGVAGVRGTLAKRLAGPDTLGRVLGKTGTLSGASSLSGLLEHRHDGQRYLFSMLMNRVPDKALGRATHDRVLEALGADRRGLGPRPSPPAGVSAVNDANGRTLTASWQRVDGAAGYLVWRSSDGRTWPRSEARYVTGTHHRTVPVGAAARLFVRVSALGAAGESDPSTVVGARVDARPAGLLIVVPDGGQSAERGTGPTLAELPDAGVAYADALGEQRFDSCAEPALPATPAELGRYHAILWAAGEPRPGSSPRGVRVRQLLGAYGAAGGALFVAGASLSTAWANEGEPSATAPVAALLGASRLRDRDDNVVRAAGEGFAALPVLRFERSGRADQGQAAELAPAAGTDAILSFVGSSGGVAGIERRGTRRVVALGFPFEGIDAAADRAGLMAAVLHALGP
jgi:serine-type D-Ala-D-Ala carboxypeptidase/endopeptidase (penicillin-binding protein 4)